MSVAFKPEEMPFFMNEAFGKPGLAPHWSSAAKQGVGTAMNDTSRVWFTIADGVITEVYYPRLDIANTRDIRFLVTDSKTFFEEEGTDTISQIEYIDPKAPAYIVTNTSRRGLYRIVKRIVTDPASNSLVMNTVFEPLRGEAEDFRLFILFAPHIKNRGYENSGRCASYDRHNYLIAWREDIAAVLTADIPFINSSAGFVGRSDGWQDLHQDLKMDWFFERADGGNIALTAQVPAGEEFNLVLSFGRDEVEAALEAQKALSRGYREIERDYIKGWKKYISGLEHLGRKAEDGGRRYWASAMVLKTHEDKTHKGGLVASLSIPWGEARGDAESAGYRLVWPRDLVKGAFAFMAMGDTQSALDVLKYLQMTQNPDGSWPQNMWLHGEPRWKYVQLDEVALPIMLAWRLRGMGVVGNEFYLMAKKAASYILKNGPVTEQERWEENRGFSPATLAAEVSALVCAAHWARESGDESDAAFMFSTADNWATRIEDWTFEECDCLGAGIPGHYLRIVQRPKEYLAPEEQVCHAAVFVRNAPEGSPHHQGEIVDSSFLDLVRYGVRSPHDPHITNSLRVVDRFIRFESSGGVAFYRYNNDAFGEKDDGSPFDGSGIGRPWPLITGERAMYEILAGSKKHDLYLRSLENFANDGLMFPEQVWDKDDIPEKRLFKGRGTDSATPLMWAHAEYIKLLRSLKDGWGCDIIDEVSQRYAKEKTALHMSAWLRTRPISAAKDTDVIRIMAFGKANIHWTNDEWRTKSEDRMIETGLGLSYFDFKPGAFRPDTRLIFTFHYTDSDTWEGGDYEIKIYRGA